MTEPAKIKPDWRNDLRMSFFARLEKCHAGCGDTADVLKLTGKRVGAWCKSCNWELSTGGIDVRMLMWRRRRKW